MKKKDKPTPIVGKRKVLKIGSSRYISIPPDWMRAHNLGEKEIEELLVVADKDIRIVNPDHTEEVYQEVTKMVKKAEVGMRDEPKRKHL